MADFSVDVQKWVVKAKANADAVFQGIATEALNRVRELTPVRSGYLKAGWQATIKGDVVPTETGTDDSAAEIAQAQIGMVITIFNPVVYARRIEYGFQGKDKLGRMYHEHGTGMMQQTISEIPAIAQRVLKRFQ